MLGKLSKILKFSTLNFVILLISFQYFFAAPVEDKYVKFINDLNSNACATPEQIKLPSNSSSAENLELLSSSLKICQNLDTVFRFKEAQYLCSEIFGNLKVVLCPNSKGTVKPLNITFSKQVCKDIASLENVSDKLLKHLTDNWSCDLLCDAVFEKACQVLHWSYQSKKNFEENERINNGVITGNSTQESILGSDLQKSQEPNKATENVQKTAEISQAQTKDTVQQPTNSLVLDTQKINSVLEHHTQGQADELQSNLNSIVKKPIRIIPKSAGANSILPVIQVKNMSHDVALKASQEDRLNNNELPENEVAGNNAGLPEIEDPHDNEGIFPHNAESDINSYREPPQAPIADQLPSVPANMQLPNIPGNIKMPNLPTNNELLPVPANDLLPANEGFSLPNPHDGLVDPHDSEEPGEEESPNTNPKAPGSETTHGQTPVIKIEITNQNEANVQTQAKQISSQNGSSTTKAASSTTKVASPMGSTKSSTITTEKKAIEIKSSSAGGVPSVSADGKKTTESVSSLPSPKDESSSVVPPISKDLSPALVNIEKMEGEEDAHEMPEDREPDQYNGVYVPAKNKEMKPEKTNEVEVSKVNVGGQEEQTIDDEFSPRSKYGPDDVPLIPAVYPGQEDGHFFFYFLSMVLILMAGYLIFHNKQKIIALIVEGRHERRRRSHGAGYKKLDTK